ncbi:hypothetical protein ASC59_09605 [Leifsonia sp. Root1293]|nr:hypothetical protein ASC59_09605 [Leifsonia sp. Root1293]KRA12227.1 hypothetical protein ASD61_09605 [Leifsonia sp. Root60]
MVGPDRAPARPEIQELRALAVGVVVLYHFWPALSPAGYGGVDVFFVVSGFLITGILLRDAAQTGRIRFARFYGRRVRRILPSALLVLAVTSIVTAVVVPPAEAARWFREILASTLFIENWTQSIESQQGTGLESTPVQHYWSLSVEEQFYLVWPLVILAGVWIASRFLRPRMPVIIALLGTVTVLSFATSLVLVSIDNNLAYFSTLSRAWEFGIGGLLACVPAAVGHERLRAVTSWLGLTLIVASVYVATDVDAFPGLLVLMPVFGAAAVIWAGTPTVAWSTRRLVSFRPVLWLGGISYALYLWHWPVVMLTPYITGRPSENPVMLLLLAISLLLAWGTTRYVEDPIRFGVASHRLRTRTIIVAAAAIGVVLVGTSAMAADALTEVAEENVACHSGSP